MNYQVRRFFNLDPRTLSLEGFGLLGASELMTCTGSATISERTVTIVVTKRPSTLFIPVSIQTVHCTETCTAVVARERGAFTFLRYVRCISGAVVIKPWFDTRFKAGNDV